MSDADLGLIPQGPQGLYLPTGYVYHEPSIAEAKALFPMGTPGGVSGAAKASGLTYFNLVDFEREYLKAANVIKTQRPLIDLPEGGRVFSPLFQQTGICDGCSFETGARRSNFAYYVMTGTGPLPEEYSFLWAYLAGRDMRYVGRGDSGAIPSLSARVYHDYGACPVSKFPQLIQMACHGENSQEALCIQYRDDPATLLKHLAPAVGDHKCPVYSPNSIWDIADCITCGNAVTYGCSYQVRRPAKGGTGISALYSLGGHETCGDGWFLLTVNGVQRLGFIKTESWGNVLPGADWPDNRVTIQTDAGPKLLYPGQTALWADEWWACKPECWALGAPGTRA